MVVPTPRRQSTARGRAAGVYAAAPTAMPAPGSSEHERVIFVLRKAILLAPGMIARPYHMAQPLWMALRDLLPSRSLKHFLRDNSDTFKIVKTEDGNSTWGFIFSSSAEPPRPPPPLRPAPVGAAGVSAAAPATALPAEEPPTATQRKVATEAATMDERASAAQSNWPVDPPGPAGVATAGPALKQRDTEVDTVSEDSADEEKKDRFSEDEDEGAKPLGKDPYFGNWTVDQFSLPLGFMKIPEAHGGLLLPLLQLKAGEGEEMEIAQLTATLKSELEARGEVFDEFREVRLNFHILALRDQNKWLLKERLDCIQWSVDKEYDGIPAFITEPQDPQYDATAIGPQLTEQAALRCRGKAHTYVRTIVRTYV